MSLRYEEENRLNNFATATAPAPPPLSAGLEYGSSSYTQVGQRGHSWKKTQLAARAIAFIFSVSSYVVMERLTNNQPRLSYKNYNAYRYLADIGLISAFYLKVQFFRQIVEIYNKKYLLSQRRLKLLDYLGDQIMTYLLISAISSASTMTRELNQLGGFTPAFKTTCMVSTILAYLAFASLGLSASISAFNLSKTYI